MLKIFGKNNNHLFRTSQKTTYSMPQSMGFSQKILKCACGFDYIAIVTTVGQLYFLFQSKFYLAGNVPLLSDVATSQNTIIMLTKDNQLFVWDFDQQKIQKNLINYTKIKLVLQKSDYIKKIQMGCSDIFLISQFGKLYHFKRNQWYETKSYSNIQSVQLSHRIVDASSGPQCNLFLSYQGLLFTSSKSDPLHLKSIETQHKFIKISTYNYNAGITKKGILMIWGDSIHGKFNQPVQLTKLTKKFVDVKIDKQNGYALSDDGQAWVWGMNANGQLGLSDYEVRVKPFPLITLQKYFVIDVFCGYSYTCCICQQVDKTERDSIKVFNKKCCEFSVLKQDIRIKNPNQNMSTTESVNHINNKKKDPIYIQEQDYEVKTGSIATPSQIKVKNKKNNQKSKCKEKQSQVNSKSQKKKSTSPVPGHKKSGSELSSWSQQSKNQKKISHQSNIRINSYFNNSVYTNTDTQSNPQFNTVTCLKNTKQQDLNKLTKNTWKIPQNQQQYDPSSRSRSIQYEPQYIQIKRQNQKLKQKVTEQQQLISDITAKIRLLEQAIDEHEKSLTSRDNILQQYQTKQKEYIAHIEQLQKTIDEIVRLKQKNNQVMVVYEDMKVNFEKQRGYYLQKIKQYQIKIHTQESKYKLQIQQLKSINANQLRQQTSRSRSLSHNTHTNISNNRSSNNISCQIQTNINKENKTNWQSHSPIVKKQQIPYFRGQFLAQKQMNSKQQVDQVIDQIQTNKSRITKSANKLIAMLDISQ